MQIAIIARQSEIYSTQRLCQAGAERGHAVEVIDPLEWMPKVDGSHAPPARPDVVVPRAVTLIMEHSLAVVRDFEGMGVPVLNSSSSIALAHDKFATLQRLSTAGVPTPRTAMPRSGAALRSFIESVSGPPIVLKLLRGFGGYGVMRVESVDAAEALLSVLLNLGQCVLAQEHWGPDPVDVRIVVVDGEVAAAMRRIAPPGDFRANAHAGGTALSFEASSELKAVAQRASAVCGLDVGGVDLLISQSGVVVTEVNATPGLKAIEESSGVDMAGRIIMAAERRVR